MEHGALPARPPHQADPRLPKILRTPAGKTITPTEPLVSLNLRADGDQDIAALSPEISGVNGVILYLGKGTDNFSRPPYSQSQGQADSRG